MLNIKAALTGTLRRMHYVRRYSSIPTIQPENVAEHSWQVAMLSYLMARDLQARGITVFMDRVLEGAILHDVSESMSGDIIRSFKHGSPEMREACKAQDWLNVIKLSNELGVQIGEEFDRAKNGMLEGHIVALADMLTVVSYCASESQLGNQQANFILQELYEETLKDWHHHKYLGVFVDNVFPRRHWSDPLNYNKEN